MPGSAERRQERAYQVLQRALAEPLTPRREHKLARLFEAADLRTRQGVPAEELLAPVGLSASVPIRIDLPELRWIGLAFLRHALERIVAASRRPDPRCLAQLLKIGALEHGLLELLLARNEASPRFEAIAKAMAALFAEAEETIGEEWTIIFAKASALPAASETRQ
jgi:hypothetical protein